VAARAPRRWDPPGGPEDAAGDVDGVGAGETDDPDRRGPAAERGDDGGDRPERGSLTAGAIVRRRPVQRPGGGGRALVVGEDEGVSARGQGPGTRAQEAGAAQEVGWRRAPPWEEEGQDASGGAGGHWIGMDEQARRWGLFAIFWSNLKTWIFIVSFLQRVHCSRHFRLHQTRPPSICSKLDPSLCICSTLSSSPLHDTSSRVRTHA
jgi:hypothetical protein